MKGFWRAAVSIFVVFVVLTNWGLAQAQSTDVQYFPETGHAVRSIFLQYYHSAKDPLLYFGYPITEQMTSKDGRTVQYFQRARFELTPDNKIQLSPLGALTYQPKSPLTINNPKACEMSPSGFPVCLAFLDFYKAHGGAAQFGDPISPFESSDGLIVQYFERARFEWRADRPTAQRVVIADLGRMYFDQLKEDPAQLKPVQHTDATIDPVLFIKVRAFVLKAVTLPGGQQTVHIVVQSQTGKAVSGATGNALVKWTGGAMNEFAFTTNAFGMAQITFDFSNQESGELVPVEIMVNYQSLTASTKTSFRIWY